MSQETTPLPESKKDRFISVKINCDALTDTIIKDKEQGLNMLLIAVPLHYPKYTVLGFLYNSINNMVGFFAAVDEQLKMQEARKKSGIVKGTMTDAIALGRDLLKP